MKAKQTTALTVRPDPAQLARVEREDQTPQLLSRNATDARCVEMWLRSKRSPHTRRNYLTDIMGTQRKDGAPGKIGFIPFVGRPLREVTLEDVYAYLESLTGAPGTRARAIYAVKSLFRFAQKTGFLRFDVSAPVQGPRIKNTLAERILTKAEVLQLYDMAGSERNKVLIFFAFATGARVSELTALKWRDIKARENGNGSKASGQVTFFGKGGKTRAVLLPPVAWQRIEALRGDAGPEDPVFKSQKGGHLDTSAVLRIVKNAADLAGIKKPVSPHWLRHAFATHYANKGGNLHLLKETLGHASIGTTEKYMHVMPNDSAALYIDLEGFN